MSNKIVIFCNDIKNVSIVAQYLNSKNINALFIQIVEKLLIEKPDNPIGFMVEYLQKTYPEETSNSMLGKFLYTNIYLILISLARSIHLFYIEYHLTISSLEFIISIIQYLVLLL